MSSNDLPVSVTTPSARVTDPLHLPFPWALGIGTQVLMLAWQALYHLHSPQCFISSRYPVCVFWVNEYRTVFSDQRKNSFYWSQTKEWFRAISRRLKHLWKCAFEVQVLGWVRFLRMALTEIGLEACGLCSWGQTLSSLREGPES